MQNTFGIDIIPVDDEQRLEVLQRYDLLDTPPEDNFDNIARLATRIFDAPIALISLVGSENIFFKANVGMGNARLAPRAHALCSLTILRPGVTVIEHPPREFCQFAESHVPGGFELKFYAGAPLTTTDGFRIGAISIIADTPRKFEARDRLMLEGLAKIVMDEIELRLSSGNMLADTNERLDMALDAGELGSYDLDVKTGLMSCSAQCKSNFGLGKNTTFNLSDLFEMILPEYREEVNARIHDAIANHSIYQAEYQITWPNGERHWINAYGKPKYDENDQITNIFGISQNITVRKVFERRKDDFLGVVSHELKTPLTSLKANLQLLDRIKDEPENPMLPKLIDSSSRCVVKINGLVDDLLNMRRFGEGQLRLEKTWFVVAEMLQLCCNHVRIAGTHELIIQGDHSLQMYADEHRIEQVIVNLVNNAIKYAPGSKEIYLIISREEDGAVKVAVRDNGSGIPREQLSRLFDKYWRANHNGAQYSGLGLGLYICSEIIRRHNGKIGVDSEAGVGSTFWFTIPS